LSVRPCKNFLSTKKHYKNTTTETNTIQEIKHPSLNKGNGKLLCRTCLKSVEYAFMRKRGIRYTAEDGPVAATRIVTIGHCLADGRYSTSYSENIVRNKQYCLSEIQSVLDGKNDFTLASKRTRAYWKSWFTCLWEDLVGRIWLFIRRRMSKEEVAVSLMAFLKGLGEHWLRYVLDLSSTNINNLCMFLKLIDATIGPIGGKLHETHRNGGAQTAYKGCKPSPGG
jgi:hypothetical protein